MRIMSYSTMDQAWTATLRALLFDGRTISSRDGPCRELVGTAFMLTDVGAALVTVPERQLSASYAAAELIWYLSGDDAVKMISAYAPQYSRFADENGRAYGSYGARSLVHRLKNAVAMIRANAATRQAVVPIWEPRDQEAVLSNGCKDVPCTTCWQFLLRDGKLTMTCSMRSNDVWLGMPYDVWVNCQVLRIMAAALNVSVGDYAHHVHGSCHLYERDADKAARCLDDASELVSSARLEHPDTPEYTVWQEIAECVVQEQEIREFGNMIENVLRVPTHPALRDALRCCRARWAVEHGAAMAWVSKVGCARLRCVARREANRRLNSADSRGS
jgi:thymidylate synthase